MTTHSNLVEAEARKVCLNGHSLGWRPLFRTHSRKVLGHCVCGAPYRQEKRGPAPLSMRAIGSAGDWVAIRWPDLGERAEDIARVAVRAYLNEIEEHPTPDA